MGLSKTKIRFHTWYWGKWVYAGTYLDGTRVTLKTKDFELYDEEKHGLNASKEKLVV